MPDPRGNAQPPETSEERVPLAGDLARAMLGAILVAGDGALERAREIVEPDDLVAPHRQALELLMAMRDRGEPVDPVLLKDELVRSGVLERARAAAYVGSLTDGLPSSANVEWYARRLKDASDRRARVETAYQIIGEQGEAEQASAPREHHLTDVGNAERLVETHGRDLRCVAGRGPWLAWDGARWRWDDRGEVLRRARATVRQMFREAAEKEGRERKDLWDHARRSEADHALQAMISVARCDVPVSIDELDADAWLLNAANGTIDLRTGKLRAPRRRDLITKLAGAAHDPDAACPTWETFLARVMDGNDELVAFLQRAVGYALTGDTSEQAIFILHGTGANGKSTFLRLLHDTLGDYARQAPTRALLSGRGDDHPTAIAGLRGARLVTSVEVDEGRRLAEGLVKQLTGGDRVAARLMRQDYFEFVPTFKLFLAVNHRPEIRGTDWAIWRRIRLIPFTVTIPPDEQDRGLALKLRAELTGILAWAVRGCLAWQRDGLGAPEAVTTATERYRADMDTLAAFLEAECLQDQAVRVRKTDLYDAYRRWSESNGEAPLTHKAFAQRLVERGLSEKRGHAGVRYWVGIGLPAREGDDPWDGDR